MKVLIIGDLLLEVAELIQEEVVVIHLFALVALEHILLAAVTALVVVLEHILLVAVVVLVVPVLILLAAVLLVLVVLHMAAEAVAVVVEVLPVAEVQLEVVAGDKTIAYNNI